MANQAAFTINGTPSVDPATGDRLYEALNNEVLNVTLEVNPSPALSARFEVFDPADLESPLASKDAPLLTWDDNALPAIVLGPPPFGIDDTITITMPAVQPPPQTGIQTYLIRCTVATPGDGSPQSQNQVFERAVVIRGTNTAPPLRKMFPAESTEARARGWSDSLNDLIDAMENFTGGAGVTSFNGRAGAVVSIAGDYDAVQVDYDNAGSGLAATEVQGAIDELAGLVGGGDLQDAYENGNTIAVAVGFGPVELDGVVDATDLLVLERTFAGAGDALQIDMGPGAEAVTGAAMRVTLGTGATGPGMVLDHQGTGTVLDVQQAGIQLLLIDSAGNVSLGNFGAPAGSFSINGLTGGINTTAGDNALNSSAEIIFTDNGDPIGTGLTHSQAGDRALVLTGVGQLYENVTSIVGALNAAGTAIASASSTLQDAYDAGQTIDVAAGTGNLVFNLTDLVDFTIQDGGVSVFTVTGSGGVAIEPTAGRDLDVSTDGSGDIIVQASGTGDIFLDTDAGDIDLTPTGDLGIDAGGDVDIDASGGELTFDDVGNSGLTLSQVGDRALVLTGGGQLYENVTSLIAALNAVGSAYATGPATHAATHLPSGSDPLTTAAPAQGIGGGNAVGAAESFARSDHDHTIRETGGATDLTVGVIADGQMVVRSGTALIGQAQPAAATLQSAYDNGQTIDALAATGDIVIDLTDAVAFEIQDGGNQVFIVNTDGSIEIQPTSGTDLTMDTFGIGNILATAGGDGDIILDANGGGDVLLQEGGVTRIAALASGAVDIDPASGQDFTVTTLGGGNAVLNAYTFPDLNVDTFSLPDANGSAGSVLTDVAGNGVLTFAALPGSYDTVQDEGSPLTQRTTINFVGAGVTAADSGGVTTVTIAGAGAIALQGAYDGGNTIDATVADGAVTIDTGTEAVAGLIVQDNGVTVFEVDSAGAVLVDPTSGQDFVVTTLGSGDIDLNADGDLLLTGDNVDLAAAGFAIDVDTRVGGGLGAVSQNEKLAVTDSNADTVEVFSLETTGANGGKVRNYVGDRNPIATVTADPGSLYLREDGVNSTVYINDGSVSGTTWRSALAFAEGHIDGLVPTYNSASTVDISPGSCRSDDDEENILVASTLTANFATSGANGLDTGSEAGSTWYYLWVIAQADGASPAALLSLSSTSPTMPGSYTVKRRVGQVRNGGSSNIVEFRCVGSGRYRHYNYAEVARGTLQVLSGGSSTSYSAVSLATFVPPTSILAYLELNYDAGGDDYTEIRPTGSGLGNGSGQRLQISDTGIGSDHMWTSTNTSQSIDYRNSSVFESLDIFVYGYVEDL